MLERSQQLEEFLKTLRGSNGFGNFDEISERSFSGDTVLHVAVRFFENDVVPELLALGIDINAIGDMRQTPLHVAVSVNNLAMAEYLIDCGAALVVCDELHGQPPFFSAMLNENDEMVYLLFRKVFGEYNAGCEKRIIDSWAQFHLRQNERLVAIDKRAATDSDAT